jgi:hypothetical protein
MYYAFKKSMIIAFLVISVFCSLPSTYIVVMKILQKGGLYNLLDKTIQKLSIGTVFKAKIEDASEYVFAVENTAIMADTLMYLNMLGILYLLIHTIFMRKKLVQMANTLDHKETTPSDFALLVRNIPKDMTKEKLTELIETRYVRGQVKVAYINMCYDIQDMVKHNTKITELIKQKGAYKLHLKKEMKV